MKAALTQRLEAVTEGSVLAEPVLDSGGNVLLPAQLSLTAAHLEGLRRRGIEEIAVAVPEEAEDTARRRAEIRQRVLYLFRHSADDPGAQALLHAVLAFREERLK